MAATPYSEITPLTPEWIWQDRIPQNMMTLVAGDGGIGKGRLLANLTSRITRGAPMPDGTEGPPLGSVILATQEDDPNLTMAGRLIAEGADLAKVFDMTRNFQVPDSLPEVYDQIDKLGDCRLVIIDPLSGVSSIALTSSNVRVRKVIMNPLEQLARDKGIGLVVVHHTVKSGRVAGTKGITDAARMVLKVSRATADDSIRLIHIEKSNISNDETGDVAYQIVGDPPRIHYLAAPPEAEPRPVSVKDQVLTILRTAQKAGESPVPAHKIAKLTGADYGTVRVALTRLKTEGAIMSPERGQWALRPAA
jgi:hypothetical protein